LQEVMIKEKYEVKQRVKRPKLGVLLLPLEEMG
jgi:hypothetical protein